MLLDIGYHLLLKKEEINVICSGHSEQGIMMREIYTKVLPKTNAKFW